MWYDTILLLKLTMWYDTILLNDTISMILIKLKDNIAHPWSQPLSDPISVALLINCLNISGCK